MKIDSHKTPENQGQSHAAQNIRKTAGNEPQKTAAELGKTNAADKVDISSKSKELAELMSAVNQLPEVREARVKELKQSVDAGTYTVDPRKVAEKIMKEL